MKNAEQYENENATTLENILKKLRNVFENNRYKVVWIIEKFIDFENDPRAFGKFFESARIFCKKFMEILKKLWKNFYDFSRDVPLTFSSRR